MSGTIQTTEVRWKGKHLGGHRRAIVWMPVYWTQDFRTIEAQRLCHAYLEVDIETKGRVAVNLSTGVGNRMALEKEDTRLSLGLCVLDGEDVKCINTSFFAQHLKGRVTVDGCISQHSDSVKKVFSGSETDFKSHRLAFDIRATASGTNEVARIDQTCGLAISIDASNPSTWKLKSVLHRLYIHCLCECD